MFVTSVMWVIGILLIIGFLCLVALASNVTVRAEYRRVDGDDAGSIQVRALFGIVRWQRRLHSLGVKPTKEGPAVTATDSSPEDNARDGHTLTGHEFLQHVHQWIDNMQRAKPIIASASRHVTVDSLKLALSLGTGEAVSTGVLCGSAWSIVYTVMGWLLAKVGEATPPHISIVPIYARLTWSVDASCIVRIPLGHAIVAALHLSALWRRRSQLGTSHSRANAHRHVEYP